jgi:UDP-N-acetyl-D-mannosaminuronate dehydrogenase
MDYSRITDKKILVTSTFKASSMKVAEAAKVIENSQRDINIVFVNELSKYSINWELIPMMF